MQTYPRPMPLEVEAIYTPSIDAPGNPLREALPPPLARNEVLNQLTRQPPYDESDRTTLTADEKYDRLDCILSVFHPLTYYIDLARALDRSLRNSYTHRNPLTPRFYSQMMDASKKEKDFKVPAGLGKSDCSGFALAGDSGIGKSKTTENILQLIPQVINHRCYNGTPFPFRQVPWIKINCPSDGSARALCVKILIAYDQVLLTDYEGLYDRKGVTAAKLMAHIKRISCWRGTGMFVVDELQNLALGPSGGAEQVLAFFTDLMHSFGLPVILIGTIGAMRLLSSSFSQARRSTGFSNPIWSRLAYDDPNWLILLKALWKYQYTAIETKLDDTISIAIHQVTQGVADNVAKLLRETQQKLVYRRPEKQIITPQFIRQTATSFFALQIDHLRLMSGETLVVPIPDRKNDKSNHKDYLLPEEFAANRSKQKSNNAAVETPRGGVPDAVAAETSDKKAQTTKQSSARKPKPDKVANPVLDVHAAAEKSGKSVSTLLVEMGLSVPTQELA